MLRPSLSFILSFGLLVPPVGLARKTSVQPAVGTPTTTTSGSETATSTTGPVDFAGKPIPTVPATIPPSETIQALALRSANQASGKGVVLGIAAIAVTTAGVTINCYVPKPDWPVCAMWTAGLLASIMVTKNMMKAQKQSYDTAKAVEVDGTKTEGMKPDPLTGENPPPLPNWEDDPRWKSAQKTLKELRDKGWTINEKTGQITTPTGMSFNASDSGSAASLQAMGVPDAQIKDFLAAMNKATAEATAKKETKTADKSESMYGDSLGGGGGASGGGADGYGNTGVLSAEGAGPKLGIDRSPAQVAGMSKLFNGQPIGISQDSAFNMINRRYDLHQKKGSFLLLPANK